MSIPELFLQNSEAIINWHREHYPESYDEYLRIRQRIKDSAFSGHAQLLKNVDTNRTVTGFLSFLAELNIADLLLGKQVANLLYEPSSMVPQADFVFDNIALSIKNLHPKNYEISEQGTIDTLKSEGGGKTSLTHKNFSNIIIEVEKTEFNTFSWERTETSSNGFLDSDLYEMSMPLQYIGEFEQVEANGYKKVLFYFIQSDEFAHYYTQDIVIWYFGYPTKRYQPIFQSDMGWYDRLLRTAPKKNNIDALIFMYAPNTLLSWPANCLQDIKNEKARVQIYARKKTVFDKLKTIFS